jgi:leucyl aminopeptidase
MLFKSALLALPLLASAVPTKRDQLVFGDNEIHSLAESSKELVGDIHLDLNELRLVQFGEDEVPV